MNKPQMSVGILDWVVSGVFILIFAFAGAGFTINEGVGTFIGGFAFIVFGIAGMKRKRIHLGRLGLVRGDTAGVLSTGLVNLNPQLTEERIHYGLFCA